MKNTERLPKEILDVLKTSISGDVEWLGGKDIEKRTIDKIDNYINSLTPSELWSLYLYFEGIINYSGKLKRVSEAIFGTGEVNNPYSMRAEGGRVWCCWMLDEEELLKAMKDAGVPDSLGLEVSVDNKEEFMRDVVQRFKDALSIMADEWENELRGCVIDVIEQWQDRHEDDSE